MPPSLYRRALGDAYRQMPKAWQALHDGGTSIWRGRCAVDGGATPLAQWLGWLLPLPPQTADAPIAVEFEVVEGEETWIRRVGSRTMRSRQFIGPRSGAGAVVEQFGPLAFDLDLPIRNGRMDLVMTGMRCFGVPIPRPLWPRMQAFESVADDAFCFDVSIELPIIGRLVRYRGSLTNR